MYLEAIVLNRSRKERLCKECKQTMAPGTDNLMLMRKGMKGGRYYTYIHPPCVLTMLWRDRERRRVKDPKSPGRPSGSSLATLDPVLAKERHQCIRTRARLMRYILASSNPTRILDWSGRVIMLDQRIKEIRPLVCAGRRNRADAARIEEIVRESEPSQHELALRKRAARTAQSPQPAPPEPTEADKEEQARVDAQYKEIEEYYEAHRGDKKAGLEV